MKTYQRVIADAPPEESKAYGKVYVLQQAVKAECWNYTDGSTADLPVGLRLKVEHPSSPTHTVCMIQDRPEGLPCSNEENGWRFIVNNVELSKAIGEHIPEKTHDLVGAIIEAESLAKLRVDLAELEELLRVEPEDLERMYPTV